MRVLHLMAGGGVGGIEVLLNAFSRLSRHENIFCILWGKGEQIAESIKAQGNQVIELEASHHRIIKPIRDVIDLCRREHIDVIVAHHSAPLSHLILIEAKKRLPGIKTIAYAHSNIHDWALTGSLRNKIRYKIFQRSFTNADIVVAISESVRDSVIELFDVNPANIEVVYNGVSIDKYSSHESDTVKTKLELIYVGRLIEEKGVQNTVRGLKNYKAEYHLSIVGDGAYRSTLETLAEGMNVSFLGTRSDVPELLAKADVFVHLPDWEEGFGITVIEAMAAGKICICGNRGAIPEIIDNGIDGFLIQVDEFAQTLEMVAGLSEPEKNTIRNQARQKAAKFSIDSFAKKLDQIIGD